MPRITLIGILILQLSNLFSQSYLFPFQEYGRWGFFDENCVRIIPPKYDEVENFSEGLAAVRLKNNFGYIDQNGKMVILAIYDRGYSFSNGYALVYFRTKPYIINRSGEILFEHHYRQLQPFHKQIIVTTQSGKRGIINYQNQLIVDTIFRSITIYPDAFILAESSNRGRYILDINTLKSTPLEQSETILMHNKGLILTENWNQKKPGYSEFSIHHAQGKSAIKDDFPLDKYSRKPLVFSDSIIIWAYHINANQQKNHPKCLVNRFGNGVVFFNYHGEVVFQDSISVEKIVPFYQNRPLALFQQRSSEEDGGYELEWVIVDDHGKKVQKQPFSEIYFDEVSGKAFDQGKALGMNRNGEICWIDTSGLVLSSEKDIINQLEASTKMTKEDIEVDYESLRRVGDLALFGAQIYKGPSLTLVWNSKNNTLTVWKVPSEGQYKPRGGEAFMGYPSFHGSSHKDMDTNGGAESPNAAKLFEQGEENLNPNTVNILIERCDTNHTLQVVKLINLSPDTISIETQDGHFTSMRLQAKSIDKNWKDITYMYPSWCGNSYYSVDLYPNHYWSFVIPKYQKGEFKTKLRIALTYSLPNGAIKHWYSELISAKLNYAQFWRHYSIDEQNKGKLIE